MTLIWHIVRKDLRRLRWWLLAWFITLITPLFLGFSLWYHQPATREAWASIETLRNFLVGLQMFTAYVCFVLLIQEDGLVGSNAFWPSRPLPALRLLAAKAIGGATILLIIPLGVMLPWWLWANFGLMDVLKASADWIGPALLFGVVVAFVASVTDTLARAILWTVALIAFGVSFFVAFAVFNRGSEIHGGLMVSRLLTAGLVLLGLAALAVAIQYLYRRRRRTVGLMAVAMVAGLVIAIASPWQWLGKDEDLEYHVERAAGVRMTVDGATVRPDNTRNDSLLVSVRATGVPPEVLLASIRADQKWSWKEGSLERRGYYYGWGQFGFRAFFGLKPLAEDDETRQWWEEQNRKRTFPFRLEKTLPPDSLEVKTWSIIPRSYGAKIVAEPPAYQTRLWMQTIQPVLQYELPLERGGLGVRGGFRSRIERIEHMAGADRVAVVDTMPFTWSDFWIGELGSRAVIHFLGGRGYFALNRTRGEINRLGGESESRTICGVQITWHDLNLRRRVIREGQWVDRPLWDGEMNIGLVSMETESIFTRELSVARLEVEDLRKGQP